MYKQSLIGLEEYMNLKNLFFHIHYCNYRNFAGLGRYSKKITSTIGHHKLVLIAGGKGSVTLDKKRYQAKKGLLLYICPDIPHFIEIDIEEPGSFFSIHFSYVRVIYNDNHWDINRQAVMLPFQPTQELKDYYPVYDGFKKLVDTWNGKLPGYEFMSRTILQQLFFTIYQNLRKANQNYGASLKVESVIRYMHQNINRQVTLGELAALVELSTVYLSRVFKAATEYSVIEYFNKIKIDRAKELIIEGDKKVKEIAQVLGFTDEFYFSRVFKRMEGISPSEFYSKNVHGV
jgi:AraC-like DNA-binding protein